MAPKIPRARPDGSPPPAVSGPAKQRIMVDDDDDDDDIPPARKPASAGKPQAKPKPKAKAKAKPEKEEAVSALDWTPAPLMGRTSLLKGTPAQAAMLKSLAAAGKAQFGSTVLFSGEETHQLVVAIPMPSIALEYLLGIAGWPLGLMIQLVAETGVGKSGLLAEIGRWFFECGGGFWLHEAETKFNPNWYKSILRDYYNMVQMCRADSQESWQRNLTESMRITKLQAEPKKKGEVGFGRGVPFLFGVDSLTGKSSEDHQEKILGKVTETGDRGTTGTGAGIAGYAGMQAAGKLTDFIRSIAQEFDFWPFSLVVIGQLKYGADKQGNELRKVAGGGPAGKGKQLALSCG